MDFSPRLPLSLAVAAVLAARPAAAEPVEFAIPAQSLSQSLLAYSQATGIRIAFNEELTHDLHAPALAGRLEPEPALKQLLSGSGLNFRFTTPQAVVLSQDARHRPGASHLDLAPAAMPPVTVLGTPVYAADDPHNPDYGLPNTQTATKTDTPIIDTPFSVQVVPRAVMNDRKANSLQQAVETVSGVGFMPVDGGVYNVFVLRGFVGDSAVFRNGLRLEGFNFDTANLERIEVLKGPSAMLYGRGQPGGLVNIVTKQALDRDYHSIEQQFGSYDFYRTHLDFGGPLNADKTLLYRLNIAYQDNNSFRDYVSMERVLVAPTLTWRPSDRTELSLGLEFQNDDFQRDDGIPAVLNRPANIPISRFLNDPKDPLDNQDQLAINLNWHHQFDDNWTVRHHFMAVPHKTYMDRAIKPVFLLDDNRRVFRNGVGQTDDQAFYASDLSLTGKFRTGGLKHEVLLGYDYFQKESLYRFHAFDTSPFAAVDIFNPVFPALPVDLVDFAGWGDFRQVSVMKDRWHGVYFQDQIQLLNNLFLTGGGRHDWAETGRGDNFADSLSAAQANFSYNRTERFSPRVGILYKPLSWLSVFGNFNEAFGTNNGRSADGRPFAPETSSQFEAGIKSEFWDGRLTANLAFYHLEKRNVLTANTQTVTDLTDQSAIGAARSRGLEFDLNGKLTDNLSINAAYAWTDTKITQDNDGNQGHQLPLAPRHSGSIWTRYEVDAEPLRGLSLAAGAFVAGMRQGDKENSVQLPGYVRVDSAISYRFRAMGSTMTAQFNVNNLLDKIYYVGTDAIDSAIPRADIIPGAPRTFLGSLKVEF